MMDKQFFHFETGKIDKENFLSWYFNDPVDVLTLQDPSNLGSFFQSLKKASEKYYLAGFFSYELGYLFEDVFKFRKKSNFPYALFHVYKKPEIVDHSTTGVAFRNNSGCASGCYSSCASGPVQDVDSSENRKRYSVSDLKLNTTGQQYKKNINKIRDYIYRGDIFQANYTMKYKFNFIGSASSLYRDLKAKQNVAYNVFARSGDYHIISLSPELFFSKKKNIVIAKPMKGTMKRGRNLQEDERNRVFLFNDEKNQSENVMIVDLLRNDLGKISSYGSVKVSGLCEVEKYNSLFQMTSTVTGRLKKDTELSGFIKSIFPCGSVTGAPKIRSMEIIRELEKEERKIYTGAIGFIQPGGDAKFNIAIRTILLRNGAGEMGVGGGIVYDSEPDDELKECKLKAYFLVQKPLSKFQLIETLLFDMGLKYVNAHLQRMKDSAEYFDFKFNRNRALSGLKKTLKLLKKKSKVRMLLDREGDIIVEHRELEKGPGEYRILVSKHRIDSKDPFYFHKTTNRELYNQALKQARKKSFFDVLFLNEKGEVTEGAITNIYMEKNGDIFTPPLECGLLNGIIRQNMLRKDRRIKEKIITLKDLRNADALYISNSVIGFQRAELKTITHVKP